MGDNGEGTKWQAIEPRHDISAWLEAGTQAFGLTLTLLVVLARIVLTLLSLPTPPPAQVRTLATRLAPVPTQPSIRAPTPVLISPTSLPTATPRPTLTATPSPTPGPLRLVIEQSVSTRYRSYFRSLSEQSDRLILVPRADIGEVEDVWAEGTSDLAIYWAARGPRSAVLLREEPYAVAVHPLTPRGDFTTAQLAALATGRDYGLTLVVGDDGTAVREILSLDQLGAETIRADDWNAAKEYVARHEGTWALIPWEEVDFRVRTTSVEGNRLDPRHLGKYPLVRRLWLAGQVPVPQDLAEELQKALRYEPPPTIELVAVGDIVLDGEVKDLMREHGVRYPFAAEGIQGLLSQPDIAYASLACSAPSGDESEFWVDSRAIEALTYAGLDVVALAHSPTEGCADLDMTDALRLLVEADSTPIGAGDAAGEIKIIEINGLRVAFLVHAQDEGDTPEASSERLIASVREARKDADLVVVSCRWGIGFSPHPSASQKELAQALAQAGATLILGHHPHMVQGLHYHNDTFTAYGLGNFVYDQSLSSQETSDGMILHCFLDASGVKTAELLPISIYHSQPALMSPEGSRSLLERIMQVTQGEDALPK